MSWHDRVFDDNIEINMKASNGKYYERKCRKHFEDSGYLTDAQNDSAFNSNDLFHLFDFVAIPIGGGDTRWVQVKSSRNQNKSGVYSSRRSISEWIKKYQLDLVAEVWYYEPRRSPIIYRLVDGAWEEIDE